MQHIGRVIDHLALDRVGTRTDFIAVGNWRVIGHDTGRLLARHGAQLVHSAPAVGVRDWSDLRIAVAAGVWLGAARPGDLLEIVSDDRAFDAVGDVATSLGIAFRRLSYRGLTDQPRVAEPAPEPIAVSRRLAPAIGAAAGTVVVVVAAGATIARRRCRGAAATVCRVGRRAPHGAARRVCSASRAT